MLKEIKTINESKTDVFASIVDVMKFQSPQLKDDLQEIINLFMESELADDNHIRHKALRCLYAINELHKVIFENE